MFNFFAWYGQDPFFIEEDKFLELMDKFINMIMTDIGGTTVSKRVGDLNIIINFDYDTEKDINDVVGVDVKLCRVTGIFKEDGKTGAEDCAPIFKHIAERIVELKQ